MNQTQHDAIRHVVSLYRVQKWYLRANKPEKMVALVLLILGHTVGRL